MSFDASSLRGIFFRTPDRLDVTPVRLAVSTGRLRAVVTFFHLQPDTVRQLNSQRESLMHTAAYSGCDSMVALLLTYWHQCVRSRDLSGNVPLHFAMDKCSRQTLTRLLTAWPKSITATNIYCATPLQMCSEAAAAAWRKDPIVVESSHPVPPTTLGS